MSDIRSTSNMAKDLQHVSRSRSNKSNGLVSTSRNVEQLKAKNEEKIMESELLPEVALQRKQVWESRNLKTISNSQNNMNIKEQSFKTRKANKNNFTHPKQDWQSKVVKK